MGVNYGINIVKSIEQLKTITKNNKNMKVSNFTSNNGNKIANQFLITEKNKQTFQSYKSIIAVKDYKKGVRRIFLDSYYWDYSVTTGKYRNQFLGEGIAETRKKIDSGEYKLKNLNK
tara:strand:+ start:115 stop:465 length:351 start_codon:yes stop_codon:yes gene_type:complete